MNDNDILELYFARSDLAITYTAKEYGTALLHLSMGFLGREDAEECVSDTYLAAWTHIPPERPERLFAWLSRVCRNASLGRLRKLSADKRSAQVTELTQELSECIPAGTGDPVAEELLKAELSAFLSRWLKTLSPEKRCLFLRRYWYGDNVKAAAAFMGIGESKAKVTLYRLREQLRRELKKEGLLA